MVDLASEQASRLTFAPGAEAYPVWSPDGRTLAFQTDRGDAFDLLIRPSSGSGAERALHEVAHRLEAAVQLGRRHACVRDDRA